MVLQRNSDVNIWGKSGSNQLVTINSSWEDKTYKIKSDNNGDCKLKGERVAAPYIDKNGKTIFGRKNYLGDIFHSEMVVVGAPSADTSFTSQNQES